MEQSRVEACWRCGTALAAHERVGRRAACLTCGSDLRCCRNCRFYDPALHNQCAEPQAERQIDKERGNFCDWFSLGGRGGDAGDAAGDARAKLAALFGRKA